MSHGNKLLEYSRWLTFPRENQELDERELVFDSIRCGDDTDCYVIADWPQSSRRH